MITFLRKLQQFILTTKSSSLAIPSFLQFTSACYPLKAPSHTALSTRNLRVIDASFRCHSFYFPADAIARQKLSIRYPSNQYVSLALLNEFFDRISTSVLISNQAFFCIISEPKDMAKIPKTKFWRVLFFFSVFAFDKTSKKERI